MTKSTWIAAAGGATAATAALVLVSWAGNHYQLVARDLPRESMTLAAEEVQTDNQELELGAVSAVRRADYADVTAVTAVKQAYSTPRQVCTDKVIAYQAPVADEGRVTGKLLGAVIGGVLGHQVGGGRGKDAATVGGAILGGVLGDKMQHKQQQTKTLTRIETSCQTVQEEQEKIIGYDVAYRYEGQAAQIRLGYQPEQRVPVTAGRIIFTPYGGANMKAVTLAIPE